jgi:putative Mg2+ transporter-C (MgtC) family protein
MELTLQMLVLRTLGAALLGGIVGFEREREKKPAGLRTIMLVTVGTALAMLMSQRLSWHLAVPREMSMTLNPTRLFSALMQGVGFLGAGTIFVQRRTVHGLTTAAAIWAMAVVGASVGVGDWVLAALGTIMAFFILRILGPLEVRLGGKKERKDAGSQKQKSGRS